MQAVSFIDGKASATVVSELLELGADEQCKDKEVVEDDWLR